MILVLWGSFALLVLVPYIAVSSSNTFTDVALNLQDSINVPQIPQTVLDPTDLLKKFLDFIDYDYTTVFDMGVELKNKTLNTTIKTTVMMISEKLDYFIEQGHESSTPEKIKLLLDYFAKQGHEISSIADTKDLDRLIIQRFDTAAAAMLQSFFDGSNLDITSLVKTAISLHAISLLRTLTSLYVWSSPAQFHWFLALSYKSEWYDSHLWQTHQTNWGNHLEAIHQANNIAFVENLLAGQILSTRPFNFGQDVLIDLIATYDLLDIYCSLNFTDHKQLITHLETLAKSGSFKILRYLIDAKAIELHLENYPLPRKLPGIIADFNVFWMQGYRYSSALHFLKKSCKHGHVDILKFFYQLDPTILKPNECHLALAAASGHFSVLEWALSKNLLMDCTAIVSKIVLNGHFRVFEQLEERLHPLAKDIQHISNIAAEQDRFNVVKWLYNKYKVLPRSHTLGYASIEMLKWVELTSPWTINEKLARNSSPDNLKWLSKNYPHTITQHVEHVHSYMATDFEKIQWMTSQGWVVIPDFSLAASKNEIETLRFGYNSLQMKPAKEHANAAARNGHVKILELIYNIDPSCIDKDVLLSAVKNNHLNAAKYLELILKLKGTYINVDLTTAYSFGNLELIEWTYQYYKSFIQDNTYIKKAAENGQLHIINWAIEARLIWGHWEDYLFTVAQWGHYPIFQSLMNCGIALSNDSECRIVQLAFKSGCLEIIRYFVEKKSKVKVAECLRNEQVNANNYHIWLWLRDQNSWEECCIL